MSLVILTTRKTVGPFEIKERKPKLPGLTKYTVFKGDENVKDFGRYSAAIRWCKSQLPKVTPRLVITLDGGLVQGIYCDVPLNAYVVDFDVEGADKSDLDQVPTLDGITEDASISAWDVDTESTYGRLLINSVANKETIE